MSVNIHFKKYQHLPVINKMNDKSRHHKIYKIYAHKMRMLELGRENDIFSLLTSQKMLSTKIRCLPTGRVWKIINK